MKLELQKKAAQVGTALGRAADGTAAGARLMIAKAQEENLKALMKKYNPVFPEQYQMPNFCLPNVIMIKDDAVRKGIEVCNGAIGWRNTLKEVEIFYLYDEAITFSRLHFIPAAVCDSVYYVDPFDRSRFIRMDCYFEKMQESRLAELQHIAYTLGAVQFDVEMVDISSEKRSTNQKASAKKKDGFGLLKGSASAAEDRSTESAKTSKRKSVAHAIFESGRQPTRPTLRWFAHDDNILNLVEMRCSGNDGMKEYTIEFNGSDFTTIGTNTAAKLDAAMGKIAASSDLKLQKKAIDERHHKLIYQIIF